MQRSGEGLEPRKPEGSKGDNVKRRKSMDEIIAGDKRKKEKIAELAEKWENKANTFLNYYMQFFPYERKLQETRKDLEKCQNTLNDKQKESKKCEEEIDKITRQKKEDQDNFGIKQKELKNKQKELKNKQGKLDKKQRTRADLSSELDRTQKNIEGLKTTIATGDSIKTRLQTMARELNTPDQIRSTIAFLVSGGSDSSWFEKAIPAKMKDELPRVQKQYDSLTKYIEDINKIEVNYNEKIGKMRTLINDIKTYIQRASSGNTGVAGDTEISESTSNPEEERLVKNANDAHSEYRDNKHINTNEQIEKAKKASDACYALARFYQTAIVEGIKTLGKTFELLKKLDETVYPIIVQAYEKARSHYEELITTAENAQSDALAFSSVLDKAKDFQQSIPDLARLIASSGSQEVSTNVVNPAELRAKAALERHAKPLVTTIERIIRLGSPREDLTGILRNGKNLAEQDIKDHEKNLEIFSNLRSHFDTVIIDQEKCCDRCETSLSGLKSIIDEMQAFNDKRLLEIIKDPNGLEGLEVLMSNVLISHIEENMKKYETNLEQAKAKETDVEKRQKSCDAEISQARDGLQDIAEQEKELIKWISGFPVRQESLNKKIEEENINISCISQDMGKLRQDRSEAQRKLGEVEYDTCPILREMDAAEREMKEVRAKMADIEYPQAQYNGKKKAELREALESRFPTLEALPVFSVEWCTHKLMGLVREKVDLRDHELCQESINILETLKDRLGPNIYSAEPWFRKYGAVIGQLSSVLHDTENPKGAKKRLGQAVMDITQANKIVNAYLSQVYEMQSGASSSRSKS